MKSHSEQLDELQKLHQQISNERKLLEVQQEYLDSAPLNLKVAVAHLEQSLIEKSKINNDITSLKSELLIAKKLLKVYLRDSDDEKAKADLLLVKRQSAIKPIEKNITEANKRLTVILEESGTRKRYLAEQEAIISHMMQDANDSINDAHTKYSQLERSISSMEVERNTLNDVILNIHLDKDSLEQETILIEDANSLKLDQYAKELSDMQSKTNEQLAKQGLIAEDIDRRKFELRAEIEGIDAKRAALFNESAELQIAKRRNSSAMDLYGL